jgi:hypothetical protein
MSSKILHRYFALFMALVVLISSTGVGLLEHECMVRGKSVELIFKKEKKGCQLCRAPQREVSASSDSRQPVFKKVQCCTESQDLKIVAYQVTLQKDSHYIAFDLNTPSPPPISFGPLTPHELFRSEIVPPLTRAFTSLYHGRGMLAFLQRYLI